MVQDLLITNRLLIPAAELQWRFSRASGPGGQARKGIDLIQYFQPFLVVIPEGCCFLLRSRTLHE